MTTILRLVPCADFALPTDLVEALRRGAMVAFPTDTVYGLGVDPRSFDGLSRLLRAKGRDESRKAVPLLLDSAERVCDWASDLPPAARLLIDRFWPGPLTLVLPSRPDLPGAIAGEHQGSVGLRVPAHPVARALAAALGGAITGTSANRAGEIPAWASAEALAVAFGDELSAVIWEGPSGSGMLPSTVVRVDADGVKVLREGALSRDTILDSLRTIRPDRKV